MKNVFKIDADIKGSKRITAPFITQNDAVSFVVSVFDGGKEIVLSDAVAFSLASTRIDGEVVVVAGEQTGVNTVTFDIGTSETELVGAVKAVAQLYGADGRVSTVSFSYGVMKDPVGDGYIPSEREKTLIETVLDDGPLVIADARQATEDAELAATYAREQGDYVVDKKPLIDKFTDEQTSLQTQLDTIVIDGDSSVEAAQARVDEVGTAHPTLKARIDDGMNSVNSQLADTEPKNAIYKKEIFKQLPLRFPDYQTIVDQEGVTYIYPQNFTIDWGNNEIFVIYAPTGGSSTKRWIVVYELESTSYKSCFHAGDHGGEGIVVKTESDGNRYLYVKTTGTSLGKFELNTLPTNLTTLLPVEEYDLGLDWQFNYNNEKWIVCQKSPAIGYKNRRTEFAIYDDVFQKVGTLSIDISNVGLFDSVYSDYQPKSQGIALGNGRVVLSIGGYADRSTDVPYNYQGLRVISMNGKLQQEGIINHLGMMDTLELNGYSCDRVEAEGVHVSPNGDIYTLLIHQGRMHQSSTSEGLIIFKEFSTSKDAIDFTSSGANYANINFEKLSSGSFPKNNGKMYNPLSGEELDTLDKICDFMIETEMLSFHFYSSGLNILDISETPIPSGNYVSLYNADNFIIRCQYIGNPVKFFNIYKNGDVRVQTQLTVG